LNESVASNGQASSESPPPALNGMYFLPETVVNLNEAMELKYNFNTTNIKSILKMLRGTSGTFDQLASDFTRQKFMRSHEKKHNDGGYDNEYSIITVAKNIVDKTDECIQFKDTTNLCERYVYKFFFCSTLISLSTQYNFARLTLVQLTLVNAVTLNGWNILSSKMM
jgi:hypothetical protein